MKRCLSERALLRVYLKEAPANDEFHLRFCADCAERYDAFVGDLQAIDTILTHTPPPALVASDRPRFHLGWVPVAAVMVFLVVMASVVFLRRPAPLPSRSTNLAALAADVSAALFEGADAGDFPQVESAPPDLRAALEAGRACTQDRYFNGECNDQLTMLLFETSD